MFIYVQSLTTLAMESQASEVWLEYVGKHGLV